VEYIDVACQAPAGALATPFARHEYDAALLSMDSSKVMGGDTVPTAFIQHSSPEMHQFLLDTFNISWTSGRYPAPWKESLVMPFYKGKGDPADPSAYRPIHILSCQGKMMERMVHSRLSWWVESNGLLPKQQYGFRSHRSTVDCLLHMEHIISDTFKRKAFSLFLFLDLKAAFDRASHIGILLRLSQLGLTGPPLAWVRDFLTARSYRVILGNTPSAPRPVSLGVPQGSVLSPLLFSILTSNLPSIQEAEFYVYADDVTISVSDPTLMGAQFKLRRVADIFLEWASSWGMEVNPEKSALMCFTRCKIPFLPSVTLHRTPVPLRSTHKHLGIYLDAPRLSWKSHIAHLRSDCLKRLDIMKSLAGTTWGASRESLLCIYKAYILGKLNYGCVLYGSAAVTTLRKLDTIQHTALRIILGAFPSTPILALYVESGMLPLQHMFDASIIRKLAAISTSEECHPLYTIYKEALNQPVTRGKLNLPFITRAALLCNITHGNLPSFVAVPILSPIPPSLDYSGSISLSLPNWKKGDLSQLGVQTFYGILAGKYGNSLHIYTDGSKLPDPISTAAAIFVPILSLVQTWRLSPRHTVVFAELFAILKALQLLLSYFSPQHFTIFSDSRAALCIIASRKPRKYRRLHHDIHQLLYSFYSIRGWEVSFQWVPSHIGIAGNEVADRAANVAHASTWAIEPYPLESNEYLQESLHAITKIHTTPLTDFLFTHPLGQIYTELPRLHIPINRRVDTAIFRLKTGHCGLNNHLFRLHLTQSPTCPSCQDSPETVEHFLLHCPSYATARSILRSNLRGLGAPALLVPIVLGQRFLPSQVHPLALHYLSSYLVRTNQLHRI